MTELGSLDQHDFLGLGESTRNDPYQFFAVAREAGPVYKEPTHGVYLVTRFDDIVSVAHRPEVFSSVLHATGPLHPLRQPGEGETVSDVITEFRSQGGGTAVVNRDPPDHTKYRLMVNRLFHPQRMREVDGYIDQLAREMVDEFAHLGRVDFMKAFAAPFPFMVIADLLGVPRQDQPMFREMMQGGETRIGNPNAAEGEGADGSITAGLYGEMMEYFDRYIEDRKRNPRDDVLSRLAVDVFPSTNEPISKQDLMELVLVLFGAGQETTVRLMTTAMQVLVAHPELQESLRAASDADIDTFIWECLRYDTPVTALFRLAREDADIGGVTVPAGSYVMLVWAAGNRDPRHFEDAETFDPCRATAAHALTFGHGIHYCPGAPLARTEGRAMVRAVLDRMSDIRLSPGRERLEYIPSFIIRGVSDLWLDFAPRRQRHT